MYRQRHIHGDCALRKTNTTCSYFGLVCPRRSELASRCSCEAHSDQLFPLSSSKRSETHRLWISGLKFAADTTRDRPRCFLRVCSSFLRRPHELIWLFRSYIFFFFRLQLFELWVARALAHSVVGEDGARARLPTRTPRRGHVVISRNEDE